MHPLKILKTAIDSIQAECFRLVERYDLFLEVDDSGNIWLGEGDGECYRVNGWHLTYFKINEIIINKRKVEATKIRKDH